MTIAKSVRNFFLNNCNQIQSHVNLNMFYDMINHFNKNCLRLAVSLRSLGKMSSNCLVLKTKFGSLGTIIEEDRGDGETTHEGKQDATDV